METTAARTTPTSNDARRLIAPLSHTALFIVVVAALAIGGAMFQRGGADVAAGTLTHRPSPIPLYLSLIALEYGLAIFVVKGVRRSGTTIRDLVGDRWTTMRDVWRDVALAAAIWGLWTVVAMVWERVHPGGAARSIAPMLPQNPVEAVVWVVVSISAGFAEELAFRGYLQRQLTAITGSATLAIVFQACVFGVAHGYQGVDACLHIVVYGAMFGMLAAWRGSLRPGMIAHAWTDVAAGLLHL